MPGPAFERAEYDPSLLVNWVRGVKSQDVHAAWQRVLDRHGLR